MPDTAVMAMSSHDDPILTRTRITDSLRRHTHDRSSLHVHFDAISPLGTEYPKTPLFAMAAGRELGATSSWPFGRAVMGLQDENPLLQTGPSALKTPPIKKEPLKELERLGMVANCKKPYSPEEDLNDRLRRAAAFLGDQDHADDFDFEERLDEIESLLGNASREGQVDHQLVDRVMVMVATARGRVGQEDAMQLDEGQDQEGQNPDENSEFTLPIRINVDNLHAAPREATAGGSKGGKAPHRGNSGGSHKGHSSSGTGRSGPGHSGDLVGGSGGTGGGDGNDGNGNRSRPDALQKADGGDDEGGEDEDEDGEEENARHAIVLGSQREAPWDENWYADQRAAFEDGETIFAHNHLSAQMNHDILRNDEGKRPKMPEAETLQYKSQFALPGVQKEMAENDERLSKAGTWALNHLHGEEGSDPGKGVMDNFPLHGDCESAQKL